MEARPIEGWLLYDATCGLCGRWVPRWAFVLASVGLVAAPLQAPWVGERTGLDEQALLTDITLLFADGRIVRGADAYRAVMRRLWWARPAWALSTVPGVRAIVDRSYRTIARHRHAVSRACRIEPGKR